MKGSALRKSYFPITMVWGLLIFLLGLPTLAPAQMAAQKTALRSQLEGMGIPGRAEKGRVIAETT